MAPSLDVTRGPAPVRRFLTLLALLVGGAVAGPALARSVAPGSAVAEFVSFLVLPFSLLLGLMLWLGVATLALLLTSGLRRPKRVPDAPRMRRGGFVFVPVSVVLSGSVGIFVGVLPSSTSFIGAFLGYQMLGTFFGILAWQLAQRGHLPTVENMNE
jgi:hypothetical protein